MQQDSPSCYDLTEPGFSPLSLPCYSLLFPVTVSINHTSDQTNWEHIIALTNSQGDESGNEASTRWQRPII